jgi:hypothetical protein
MIADKEFLQSASSSFQTDPEMHSSSTAVETRGKLAAFSLDIDDYTEEDSALKSECDANSSRGQDNLPHLHSPIELVEELLESIKVHAISPQM